LLFPIAVLPFLFYSISLFYFSFYFKCLLTSFIFKFKIEHNAKKKELDEGKNKASDIQREIKEKEDFLALDFGTYLHAF